MNEGWYRYPITPLCFRFLPLHQLKPFIMSVLFFPSGFFRLIKTRKQNGQEDMFCFSAGCSALWGQQCGGLYLNCTVETWTQSQRLAAARKETLIPAFHFGAFWREQLWACHMLKIWHAIYESLQSMWGLSIPFPPPYTIYKRQSVALRMSCKPQRSLHKKIRQASFTKTPYKKILKMLHYAYKNMHN